MLLNYFVDYNKFLIFIVCLIFLLMWIVECIDVFYREWLISVIGLLDWLICI